MNVWFKILRPVLVCVCVCVCGCVCVIIPFILDVKLFVDATRRKVTQDFFTFHLRAVLALIFLARRIQPFLSLVDRIVEFCALTTSY